MKKQKINLPIDGTAYPVEIKVVQHKDDTENVFCWATLDNGKTIKLEAKLTLLPKPDENGHEWHIKCNACSSHAYDNERLADAFGMFMWDIQAFNSMIEADKYVEVKVRIPKEGGCEECPLFMSDEAEDSCRYLNAIIFDTKKHGNCPARQRKSV